MIKVVGCKCPIWQNNFCLLQFRLSLKVVCEVAKNQWELGLLSGILDRWMKLLYIHVWHWAASLRDPSVSCVGSKERSNTGLLPPPFLLSEQRFQLSISQILQNLTNSETKISLQTLLSDEQLSLYKLGNKFTVTIYSMKLSMDMFCSYSEHATAYSHPPGADTSWNSRCHTLSELQVKTMELLSRMKWSAGR